jgi:spoIIIJ-associated protein
METMSLQEIIKELIGKMGFRDYSVNYDEDSRRFSIIIDDSNFIERGLVNFISDLNYLVKLVTKKNDWAPVVIDVNNYRKKREELIIELAKAAARKVAATQTEIALPPMNAYERRLIHAELAERPDLKTESAGEGKERGVVIKPL